MTEKAVIYMSLFWEKAVLRRLAISNLIAHRVRNRCVHLLSPPVTPPTTRGGAQLTCGLLVFAVAGCCSKTMIMYGLSLAFIVFISTAANMEVTTRRRYTGRGLSHCSDSHTRAHTRVMATPSPDPVCALQCTAGNGSRAGGGDAGLEWPDSKEGNVARTLASA